MLFIIAQATFVIYYLINGKVLQSNQIFYGTVGGKMFKRIMVLLIVVLTSLVFASTAFAIDTAHNLADGPFVIMAGSGDHTFFGSYEGTDTPILVKTGYSGQITLQNANIKTRVNPNVGYSGASPKGCGITIQPTANVSMVLVGSSTIRSAYGYAGVGVQPSASLTISGSGSLDTACSGDMGTGIGGSAGGFYGISENAGAITINSGSVISEGGDESAGIGGGYDGSASSIAIHGGDVKAYGGCDAAGIGGGVCGNSGTILVDGGKVHSWSGGDMASGIGHGICKSGLSGSVIISGNAEVEAHGDGSAIGSSDTAMMSTVSIRDNAKVLCYNPIVAETFNMDRTAQVTWVNSPDLGSAIVASNKNISSGVYFVGTKLATSKTQLACPAFGYNTSKDFSVKVVDDASGKQLVNEFYVSKYGTSFVASVNTTEPVSVYANNDVMKKHFYNVSSSSRTFIPLSTGAAYYTILDEPQTIQYSIDYYVGEYNLGSTAGLSGVEGQPFALAQGTSKGGLDYFRPANEYSEGKIDSNAGILTSGNNRIKVQYLHQEQ